jgi:hypothetical protein
MTAFVQGFHSVKNNPRQSISTWDLATVIMYDIIWSI